MGTLNTTVFARNKNKVNTYIGGVSSFINTPAILASILGIVEGRISLFSIYGDNIECSIKGSYSLRGFEATSGSSDFLKITYYRDPFGLVTGTTGYAFYQSGIMELYLPKATSISDGAFDMNYAFAGNRLRNIYAPLCTSIGSSVLNNNVFRGANVSKLTIYLSPFLATCNAGSPDGDVAGLISRGATIRYVTNFTVPNKPTISTIIANTFLAQINFTPPSTTNAIDYYEVYVNGVFKNRINSSGDYTWNLLANTANYIQIIAVDIFFNKSEISTPLSFTTLSVTGYQIGMSAYLKLATNSFDFNGLNRSGVDTSMTYASGYAKFGTGYIDIADNDAFSFTDGTNDTSAHIAFGFIWNDKTGSFQFFLNKRGESTNTEWQVIADGTTFAFWMFSNGTNSSYISISIPKTSISTGVLNTVQFSYDGSKSHTGLKAYLNGVSIGTSSLTGTYTGQVNGTSQLRIGKTAWNATLPAKADMKHLAIWKNRAMTPTEIAEIDYRIKNNIPLI